jgi:hypothetical protein
MKKISSLFLSILALFILVGCGSVGEETNKEKVEEKTYNIGDTVVVKDNSGKELYSLTINKVKNSSDFEYKSDFNSDNQIIEVEYVYKNINSDNDIYIHGADLIVSDENGTIADYSSMFPKGKPENVPKGTNCIVNAYYGLKNESSNIKINFKSNSYPKNNFVYKINIE